MGILDKIEQICQGLMLFDGYKKVTIQITQAETADIYDELMTEYNDVTLNYSKEEKHDLFSFELHGINFGLVANHEA